MRCLRARQQSVPTVSLGSAHSTQVSDGQPLWATVPKNGGHQPHNWQAGVRFNLTIVGGTHVVAAPSCAGLAFIVSEVAQGGTWVHLQRFGAEGSP